jgi:hypothetical protein
MEHRLLTTISLTCASEQQGLSKETLDKANKKEVDG